jgi:hypothetical protein
VLLYCGFAIVFNLNTELGPGAKALQHCEHENSHNGLVNYTCTFAGFSQGPLTVIFEGFKDSPFVGPNLAKLTPGAIVKIAPNS